VAGLNKLAQRVARTLHFVAAHRTRHVEDHTDGNRRIVVAEKRDLLLLLVVEDGKRALA
jgi:hypothetical protein